MQVKLLRAIQEKRVRKVGATGEEPVDVRIISATHNDLAERVQQGKFRQDLYYRLNVIQIPMPPLRELREDIAVIAQRALERLSGDATVKFAEEAKLALEEYDFPGNVRELENVVERALALCSNGVITVDDLQLSPCEPRLAGDSARDLTGEPDGHPVLCGKSSLPDYLDRVEKQALLEALQQTGFNRTAAAKLLGLTFRTMRYRMERLGIKDPTGDEKLLSGHPTDDA
jgi:two-component system response regulator PilR (NtrC family)